MVNSWFIRAAVWPNPGLFSLRTRFGCQAAP